MCLFNPEGRSFPYSEAKGETLNEWVIKGTYATIFCASTDLYCITSNTRIIANLCSNGRDSCSTI